MERYEEYKDSGIEWIGEIPLHLEVERNKYLFEYEKGSLPSETHEDCNGYAYIGASDLESPGAYTTYTSDETLPDTSADDLLVLWDGARAGISGTGHSGKIASTVMRVFSVSKSVNSRFLYWWYKAAEPLILELVHGTTIPHMSKEFVEKIYWLSWSCEEQAYIANYLDWKTSGIDSLIEKTEKSVELFKDYRKSVISEAVTKGLDADIPMKDSGIEWIGEIPVHWEVKKFKYIASVRANLVNPEDYSSLKQVSPERIEKGTGKLHECQTALEVGVKSDNHLFRKGQLLYSKVRPALNKVTIAPFDGLCSADMYPIETSELPEWLLYAMLSQPFVAQVRISTDRVKMPKVNKEELGAFSLPVPPAKEQAKIAEYLKSALSSVDMAISSQEQLIEALLEYRKSLISEAVTGKFKVPGVN